MSDIDQLSGTPFSTVPDKKKLPGALHPLTILTFIGCAIGLIFSVYGHFTMKTNLDNMEKMQGSEQLEKMPEFMKKMFSDEAIQQMRITYENRVPLLILSLIGIGLCLYGAIEMRKLKKQGYFMWLIGEVLPLAGSVIFVGAAGFTGFGPMTAIIITVVFIILYSLQLKHLK